jgi:hypothetical protein
MPDEIFTFNKQLKVGNKGEALFLKHYKGSEKSDMRKYDLLFEGKKVELKTDTYPLDKTPNFFMERYGSVEDKKEGGPWRAKNDKIDLFVYLFISDNTFFWFETKPLVKFLNRHIKELRGKTIPNKTYSSLGYCVARDDLEHLIVRKDKFKK